MVSTFIASIQNFEKFTAQNLRYIAAESVQDVMESAMRPQPGVDRTGGTFEVGKIPVVSGDLIRSLRSSIGNGGGEMGKTSYIAVIAGMDPHDVLTFEWTMEYAARIEFGFTGTDELGRTYNQPGRHFVGANAARFSEFVERNAAEVRR